MSRIAIIGSGISGLTCAYLLGRSHHVEVFEANDYIGGHTATKKIQLDGKTIWVDTGFIVFNDWTYPNFIELLKQLKVAVQDTEMSFSVKCTKNKLEYSGNNLNTLFSQRKNLFKPSFWRMLKDIIRFNREAVADLEHMPDGETIRLGEYLRQKNYSDGFINHYLIPMGSAIWSTSQQDMMNFPLLFFVRFFKHHGLLSINDRPQWKVIKGGSKNYVEKLLTRTQATLHLAHPVQQVQRNEKSVTVLTAQGQYEFDQVIFACHSDQALALLDQPSTDEQRILSAIPYQQNEVVLHTDDSLLPVQRRAWASWNYDLTSRTDQPAAVTYNMNILQHLPCEQTVCVTLNNTGAIDPEKIIEKYHYSHPVFTAEGIKAQAQWELINGIHHTWYCGAYWHNGFHEDGVNSALRVCKAFGEAL